MSARVGENKIVNKVANNKQTKEASKPKSGPYQRPGVEARAGAIEETARL